MGHPQRDPHGELIPTADLRMPVENAIPLSALRPARTGTIRCVKAADPDLLR
jgi:DtxR family Mn-dependent transcriptional regulator